MHFVYIIEHNDILLTDEAYTAFDLAADMCEVMLEFRPTEVDKLYEIAPMDYIRIKKLYLT